MVNNSGCPNNWNKYGKKKPVIQLKLFVGFLMLPVFLFGESIKTLFNIKQWDANVLTYTIIQPSTYIHMVLLLLRWHSTHVNCCYYCDTLHRWNVVTTVTLYTGEMLLQWSLIIMQFKCHFSRVILVHIYGLNYTSSGCTSVGRDECCCQCGHCLLLER